jgi:hypothetical protein
MNAIENNKARILELYQVINLKNCSIKMLKEFISDPSLIDYFITLHVNLPGFELHVDEITAEGKRVNARSKIRYYLKHKNKPSRLIDFPLVIGYSLTRGKVSDYWIISDTEDFFNQWKHFRPSLAISKR